MSKKQSLLLLRIALYGLGPLYAGWVYARDVQVYGPDSHLSPINIAVRHEMGSATAGALFLWAAAAVADIWFTCWPDDPSA